MNIDLRHQSDSAYFSAFILVVLSGLLWSFGVVTVRYMIDAHDYVFNYLFYRGISIAVILIVYLFIREGLLFYKNFLNIGISGVLGGLFLATAFMLLNPMATVAKEGYMCDTYYKNIQRKEKNIKDYGSDLSIMAKRKLFKDLIFDTEQCISECEGRKFKYCNKISKWISQ